MKKYLAFMLLLSSLGIHPLIWADSPECEDAKETWCEYKCFKLTEIKGYCKDQMDTWISENCEGNINEPPCPGALPPPPELSEHEIRLLREFHIESDAKNLKQSRSRQNIFAALEGITLAEPLAAKNLSWGDNLWAYFNAVSDQIAELASELGVHSLWQIFESGGDKSVLSVYPKLAHACLEDKAVKSALSKSNAEQVKRVFIEDLEGAVKEGFLDAEQGTFLKNLCFFSSDKETQENRKKNDERTIKCPYLYWKLARQFRQDSVTTVAALEQMGAVCDKGMILKPLMLWNGLLVKNKEAVKAVLETIKGRGRK